MVQCQHGCAQKHEKVTCLPSVDGIISGPYIHSQSLSWIPVGSLANYIHAHKKTVSNNRFFHNLYIHTITALQIFVPSLLHTSLCFHGTLRCHKYICCGMLPWTSAGTYVCTYIHSRAFSVSCCSILWFLKYVDRMQRRGAMVAAHTYIQSADHTYIHSGT